MTNPSELEAGRWIKATLTAAALPPAYLDVIPTEQEMPAIRFSCRSRRDVLTVGQHIAQARWRFLVVGVRFEHEAAELAALAAAIDDALHGATGGTDKLQVVACTRIQTWGDTSTEAGGQYRLAGGIYEIVGAGA